MEDEIKKKRYYIYENIDKIKNHDQIIDLIQIKECKYTKNNNGIFLNLTTTEDSVIDQIYFLLNSELNYSIINDNDIGVKEDGEILINNYELPLKHKVSAAIKTPTCDDFTPNEQERILYSKLYHLKM